MRLAEIANYTSWVESVDGKWPGEEPLSLLLEHSDCSGFIHWSLCKPLANRLKEVLETMHILSKSSKTDEDYINGKKLVEGLGFAYEYRENFVFE